MKMTILSILVALMTSLSAVSQSDTKLPKGAVPVTNFDVKKYMGQWFELARMDHRFERNLEQVTANYRLLPSGKVEVINKGYHTKKEKWKSVTGKAKFRGKETVGALAVSFFGPFYSAYNVIALDKDFKYALVCGKSLKYLWILSRETTIPENIKENYLKIAKDLGYPIDELVWVKHQ